MNVVLYVGNLAKSISMDELRNLFSQVGEVTSIRLVGNAPGGISGGYGFVGMSSQNEADTAVSRFNGYELSTQRLRVGLVRWRQTPGRPRPLLAP